MVNKNTNKIKEKETPPKNKDNKKKSKKNKSTTNTNTKKNIQSGGNVGRAAIGLVKESIKLGKQIFKTAGGIMRMPYDMQKGIPPPEKKAPAQTEPAQPRDMPNNDFNSTPNP